MNGKATLWWRLGALLLASVAHAEAGPGAASRHLSASSHLQYAVAGVLLAPLVAGCLARLACHECRRRHREPTWVVAWGASLVVLALTTLFMLGSDSFRLPGALRQDQGLVDRLVYAGLPSAGLAFIVAFIVVAEQRDRYAFGMSPKRRRHLQRQHKKQRWRILRWVHAFSAGSIMTIATWWCFSNSSLPSGSSLEPASTPLLRTDFAALDAQEKVRIFEQHGGDTSSPTSKPVLSGFILGYIVLLGMSGSWLAFTVFRWQGIKNPRLDPGLALWARLP